MRILGVLLLSAFAYAGPADLVTAELVREYEDLAKWCARHKLFAARDGIYERVLVIDPDHKVARKWLKYQRRDGAWRRPRPYRRPKNFNKKDVPAYRARLADLERRVAARYIGLVKAGGPGGARALEVLLRYLPDAPDARRLNGEVNDRGRWVLRETVTARKRRGALLGAAGRLLRAVPPARPSRITDAEARLGVRWETALQGQWWRGVGACGEREMQTVLRACDASAEFFHLVLPDAERPLRNEFLTGRDYGLFLLTDRTQYTEFIRRHQAFDPKQRRFASRLAGTWVPGTRQAVGVGSTSASRLDGFTRQACGTLLRARYGRFRQGWIIEGFGFYLSYPLVGTRLTTFVNRSRYADGKTARDKLALWARMQMRNANWLRLARDVAWPDVVDLRLLTTKELNHMDERDLLISYAMAAYLIEGRPEEVSPFLVAFVETKSIDKALASACKLSVPAFLRRVQRWLEEAG